MKQDSKQDATPAANADTVGFDRILDVRVEMTVELGRRQISIAEVLRLGPGSMISFPKAVDEPLDIRVNGQLVARGEAVVMGERYGVRITEVVSPGERLKNARLNTGDAS